VPAIAVEPRQLVRAGYDRASLAYRGDEFELDPRSGYAHWLRRLDRLILPGSRVLDLGCGNGLPVARELAKRHQVTGLDLSAVQIERARGLVPAARFVCADMTEAAFEPGSFDAVTAFFSIINVPAAEQPGLFRRIAGWLAPGGAFLAILGKCACTLVERDWRGVKGATMYWSHAGLPQSRRSIAEAGMQIVEEGSEPAKGSPGFAVVIARTAAGAGD